MTSRAAPLLCAATQLCAAAVLACAPSPAPPPGPAPDVAALFPSASLTEGATSSSDAVTSTSLTAVAVPVTASTASTTSPQEPACASDDDCGYDPRNKRCGADPRFNKQPPLVDQGIVCYCDAPTRACGLLRVDPAPCEGDTSCAVRLDPRPHPVRASAAHAYSKPPPCRAPRAGEPRRTVRHATCERTNICTMHTRECAP